MAIWGNLSLKLPFKRKALPVKEGRVLISIKKISVMKIKLTKGKKELLNGSILSLSEFLHQVCQMATSSWFIWLGKWLEEGCCLLPPQTALPSVQSGGAQIMALAGSNRRRALCLLLNTFLH